MGLTLSQYDALMREYDRNKLMHKRELDEKFNEIYSKIPRIREINESISSISIQGAKRMLLEGEGTTEDIKKQIEALSKEKASLLRQNGYPEDYLTMEYTCPKCQDTGYVGTDKCNCFIDQMINSLYLQSNLKNVLSKENFDTFSMEYYSKELMDGRQFSPYDNMYNIVQKSDQFIKRFEEQKKERGNLLIYGETGLGKTFLTNCIAKELLDKKHSVLYLSSNELFENILGGYLMQQKIELEDLYKYIYNCELLIIDDLGTELTNSFVQSQLFEIINKRELSGLSTLISTNLSMLQLRDKYSERIMSRIVANYTVFNIYGDNIRYQKRKKAINSIT